MTKPVLNEVEGSCPVRTDMKEILILAINRIGDLLQLTPLMAGIKGRYPGATLSVVVESNFAEVCKGIPFIDKVYAFDLVDYARRLTGSEYSLVHNFRELETFFLGINHKEYDLMINLTYTPFSAYMASLIKAREVRGVFVDGEGHRLPKHPWIYYFLNGVMNRHINPFNVVDQHLKVGQSQSTSGRLYFDVPEEDTQWADSFLRNEGMGPNDILIGLQPGASKDHKRWPAWAFGGLADMLRETLGAKVIIFGAKSEIPLGEEVLKSTKGNIINAVGKTTLPQLAALLKRCSVLVSNDTGTMHIATAAGTRVLLISLGAAHYRETGPYGTGHLVIHADLPCFPCGFSVNCSHMLCRERITVEQVLEAIKILLIEPPIELGSPVRDSVFREGACLMKATFDENGMLEFVPVYPLSLTKDAFYLALYRRFWPQVMDGKKRLDQEEIRRLGKGIAERVWRCYFIDESCPLSFEGDLEAIERLKDMAIAGIGMCQTLLDLSGQTSLDAQKIKALGWKLHQHKNSMTEFGLLHACLKPITAMFDFRVSHLEGDGLLYLTQETLNLYEEVAYQCDLMLGFMTEMLPGKERKFYINTHPEEWKDERVISGKGVA